MLTTDSYGTLEDDEANHVIRFPDRGVDYTMSENSPRAGVALFRFWRRFQVETGLSTDGKKYWKQQVVRGLDGVMKNRSFDAVIASYPTPVNLELGEIIHRKYGIPLVVDYRDGLMYDPFPEVADSFFVYKRRLLSLERRLAGEAALQVTVNQDMNDYYTATYPQVRSVVITNGYDDEEPVDGTPLDLPAGINVLYTGAIGKSRKVYSPEELSAILGRLFTVSGKVNFIFVGEYDDSEKALFSRYGNVYVFDKTDRKRIIATQRKADALLLISGPAGGTSGKMYEYMFSGKPILNIGGHRGVGKIIDGKHYGLTAGAQEPEQAEQFIRDLESGSLCFEKGDLEKYTRRHQCEELARELDTIIQNNEKRTGR